MKIFTSLSLLILTSTLATAQTVPVSGTVNDEKGQPVPYAFVRDVQHNYATYADSTGTFLLKADPASSLEASALSFKNAQLKIENKTNVKIVLPSGVNEGSVVALNAGNDEQTNHSFLLNKQLLVTSTAVSANSMGGGGNGVTRIKTGFDEEPTRGSRYLFENWVKGYGISKKDSLIVEKAYVYNYDKMNGNIIYTNDGKSMAQVSTSQIKNFSLYDKKGHVHIYENAPEINNKPFVEVLLITPKYKIYKKIDTKLQRADFHTDGVLEMGHRYDEYVDVERYVFVGADGKPQSISLKKSTLKKLLGNDADAFIASQGSRDIDEDYVRDLGSSLSK